MDSSEKCSTQYVVKLLSTDHFEQKDGGVMMVLAAGYHGQMCCPPQTPPVTFLG